VEPTRNEVMAVFIAALNRDRGAERAAYLDAACEDRFELRRRVEVLLTAHDRADEFLGSAGAPAGQSAIGTPTAQMEVASANPDETTVDRAAAAVAEGTAVTYAGYGSRDGDGLPRGTATRYFGDYEILKELGRGGMGVVYEAEQISLGRHVALKVLPFAAAIDPKQRQRFQIEAQAAAQLHHPHIVPIFNVGCDHGIHYYAMQFVEGRSLAAVLHELRHGADCPVGAVLAHSALANLQSTEPAPSSTTDVKNIGPVSAPTADLTAAHPAPLALSSSETAAVAGSSPRSGSLSLSATASGPLHQDRAYCQNIARLGVEAADALEHAHGLGILHRDIKPANLLIDPHGALWITDFGLALFPGDLSLTHTGDVVGTLRYMSPEQAMARRGVVDQRSDIYALGATLYELLTLQPAFDGRDHQELLRQIALDEPIRPRRLNPAVPRDLETIVLKAMAKDPSLRYATASDLAADLRRFLDDRPILARRPNPLELSLRWALRHRELVATATAIIVLSSIVGTAAIWAQARKTKESLRRHEAYVIASYPLLDRLGMDAIKKASQYLDSNADTPSAIAASQTIEQAVKIFQEAIELPPSDQVSRAVVARAYSRLGSIHWLLSLPKNDDSGPEPKLLAEAIVNHRKAVSLLEELLADSHGDPKIRRYLAEALGLGAMGCCYLTAERQTEAESLYRRAIQIKRELLRGTGETADVPNQAKTAIESEDLSDLVKTVRTMVALLDNKGKVAEAEAMRRDLEDDIRAIAARFSGPEYVTQRRMWAMMLNQLTAGEYPPPNQAARRDMMINSRMALVLDPKNVHAVNGLAWALISAPGDPWFDAKQGLELAQKAVALEPNNWAYLNTLGVASFRAGDWEAATKVLQQSITFTGGAAHDLFFLAMSHWHLGSKKQARDLYDRAVAWTDTNRPDDPELREFRAEAALLLGQPCAKQPKPASQQAAETNKSRRRATPANKT
jgi:serine/threonine protein kinase